MTNKKTKYNGLVMTELIVAMIVLSMIMVAFAISLDGFGRLNHYYFTKQRCISAAQASLDSIAVTGRAINQTDLKRLWPDIDIHIDITEGADQWKGLKLVSVTAIGKIKDKKMKVCLSRYFTGTQLMSAFEEQ
jgi:hypothetical protein